MTIRSLNRSGMLCACVLAATLNTGCASAGRGQIPFGTWEGSGFFVSTSWESKNDDSQEPGEPEMLHRSYPTSLSIQPAILDGHDIIEIEIVSRSGESEGDEGTHLKIALVEAERVSDSIVLYRIVDKLFNPSPGQEFNWDEEGPPYSASCISLNGLTVFQILYDGNFWDTFRFEGSRVDKNGMFLEESGLTHWSERLTK